MCVVGSLPSRQSLMMFVAAGMEQVVGALAYASELRYLTTATRTAGEQATKLGQYLRAGVVFLVGERG